MPLVAAARGDVDEVRAALAAAAAEAGRPASATEVVVGPDAATVAAGCGADVVLNGVTGSIGLRPTLAALAAGSVLALANKESLIIGGPLVKAAAGPDQVVPVDSEHSAIAQSLRGGRAQEVRRLVVTASGGPFRGRSAGRAGRRHARAGTGPPQLRDGPGRSRPTPRRWSTRGSRSSRRTCSSTSPSTGSTSWCTRSSRSTRWSSSTTARPSPSSGRRACSCPSRWGCPGRSGSRTSTCRATGPGRRPGSSTRSTTTPSRPCGWPGRSARPAAPTRPSTTPPTRCASTRSTTARSGSPTSSTPSSGWSTRTPARRATRTASRECSPRTPGHATRPPACSASAGDDPSVRTCARRRRHRGAAGARMVRRRAQTCR